MSEKRAEAIMLGGLAMKKRWQEARKAAGKDHFHPNIVRVPLLRVVSVPTRR